MVQHLKMLLVSPEKLTVGSEATCGSEEAANIRLALNHWYFLILIDLLLMC